MGESVFQVTARFLELLPEDCNEWNMCLEEDGEVNLEWYECSRNTFIISINKNGKVSYAGLFLNEEKIESGVKGSYKLSYSSKDIPENILKGIRKTNE